MGESGEKCLQIPMFDMFYRFLSEYNVYNTIRNTGGIRVARKNFLLGLAIRVASLLYPRMTY